jgi:hypothetical protein
MDLNEGLEVRGVAPQAEFLAAVRLEQEYNIVLWAAHYGLSREAYLERVRVHMENLMKDAQPWIRIPARVFLQVLADGRMKTMEETGLHGSADHGTQVATESYRQGRLSNELAMFGIPLDAPAAERPFYGYLSRDVDGQVDLDRSVLGAWGDVAVRLRPEVLPRTTVTFDDSGSMSRNIGCPSPALAPELYSFRYMSYEGSVYNPPSSQGKFDENKYPDPLQIKGPDGPGFPSYFETHYRGGVEVARDFAEVVWGKGLEFGATPALTEEIRRAAEAQLQRLGIVSREGYRQHGLKQAGLVASSEETFELARRELEREYDRLILAFKKRGGPALREQLGANGWSGQPLDRDEWTRTVYRKRR